MILIGNKSDLTEERRISIEEGKEMAKSRNNYSNLEKSIIEGNFKEE